MPAKTVAEKLRIQPDTRVVIEAPTPEQRALVDPLPEGVEVVALGERDADVALFFADDRASLDAVLDRILPHVDAVRAAWIAYPKGNRADINRDSIWRRMEELGRALNANVALDETWSAVRIKRAG